MMFVYNLAARLHNSPELMASPLTGAILGCNDTHDPNCTLGSHGQMCRDF